MAVVQRWCGQRHLYSLLWDIPARVTFRDRLFLAWDAIEGKDERAAIVRRLDFVRDVNQQPTVILWIGAGVDLFDTDTRLPHAQRLLDVIGGESGGGSVVGREDQVVNLAAKLRAHHTLPFRRQ